MIRSLFRCIFSPLKEVLLFILMILSLGSLAHPLHLSITNISIENGEATVNIKAFADDFAEVVSQANQTTITLSDPLKELEGYLNHYIFSHFKITCNGNPIKLVYTTYELVDLSIIVTYKFKVKKPIKSMLVENRLFYNWFNDQKNLLIVSAPQFEKGYELSANYWEQLVEF